MLMNFLSCFKYKFCYEVTRMYLKEIVHCYLGTFYILISVTLNPSEFWWSWWHWSEFRSTINMLIFLIFVDLSPWATGWKTLKLDVDEYWKLTWTEVYCFVSTIMGQLLV